MSVNHCQNITNRFQTLLLLIKEFDGDIEKHNLPKLFELQDKLIDELNLALNEYQESYWPSEKFPRTRLMIGGKKADEIVELLLDKESVPFTSLSMIRHPDFSILPDQGEVEVISVQVQDFGFRSLDGVPYDQICQLSKEFGLELCPSEVGPYYCMQVKANWSTNDIIVAMKPIGDEFNRYIFWGEKIDNRYFKLNPYIIGPQKITETKEILFCLPKIKNKKRHNINV